MSFGKGALAEVYVNGYDMTGYLKDFSGNNTVEKLETTTFGKSAKTYIPGLAEGTLNASGLYDPAAGASEPVFKAALGTTSSIWTYFPAGDTSIGDTGLACGGIETSYEIKTPVAGVQDISADTCAVDGLDVVKSYHPLGSEATGTVNSASIDGTASSALGGVGYLHVTALTATSIDVVIQDSANDADWATIITFTQVTAAPASERSALSATATVRRYVRASATITGAGAATYSVSFRRR